MERSKAHLDLAIELDSEPISGYLTTPGSEPKSFSGWIELVAAIEAARAGSSQVVDLHNGRWPSREAAAGG